MSAAAAHLIGLYQFCYGHVASFRHWARLREAVVVKFTALAYAALSKG
jgi:hypothetical protein